LTGAIAAVVTVGALTFDFGMCVRHLARHQQRFDAGCTCDTAGEQQQATDDEPDPHGCIANLRDQ
jgi:hypothetical protein